MEDDFNLYFTAVPNEKIKTSIDKKQISVEHNGKEIPSDKFNADTENGKIVISVDSSLGFEDKDTLKFKLYHDAFYDMDGNGNVSYESPKFIIDRSGEVTS